ncbi:phosphopantetheine-binding protein [Streptomyces sp. NPDC047525]|uniref:phosphopantetheine-binding protein n=1 Tax=Streptomyces sp. NPDC047525 TaxID=3155264 RepID=UPI0033F1E5AF
MEGDFETETEHQLAIIWADVLKLDKVRPEDDFFGLGGDSLLATSVMLEARRIWNLSVTVRVLIDTPVLGDLAARIDLLVSQQAAKPTPSDRA